MTISSFLRKVGNRFVFPNAKDDTTIPIHDIATVPPPPLNSEGTFRSQTTYRFALSLVTITWCNPLIYNFFLIAQVHKKLTQKPG